jgi:sugar phosphate permease
MTRPSNVPDPVDPSAASKNVLDKPVAAITRPKLGETPTTVRYGILALIICMSVLLYLDRFAFSPVASTIRQELSMDEEQVGVTTSWFFYSYALCMIPAAWMADRFGARRMLFVYVAVWSLAVAVMGFAGGFVALAAGRFFLGVGQAGAYPAAAGLIKKWFPAGSRGTANSLISMAGRGGGLLTMILTPLLMTGWGGLSGNTSGLWRAVFMLYGSLGIVWCFLFWKKFRDTPAEHPQCNEAEIALVLGPEIVEPKPETVAMLHAAPALAAHTPRYRFYRGVVSMIMMCFINILVNIGWIFLAAWMPFYLKEIHGLTQNIAGLMTSFSGLAGMGGSLCGGILTDYLVRRMGLTWGRRIPGMIAGGLGALLYLGCLNASNVWVYVGLFIVVSFVIDLGLAAIWSTYQDIGGKNVATLLGVANMCGNLAAAVFATQIGVLAKANHWQTVFLYSCVSLFLVAICWLFVNAGIPMLDEEKRK